MCVWGSGSTGKPKGVLHTCAGYMLFAASTTKYDFDLHPDDIYWCTADVGWITGHTYVCYGPLANGVTSVVVSPVPTGIHVHSFVQTAFLPVLLCHFK